MFLKEKKKDKESIGVETSRPCSSKRGPVFKQTDNKKLVSQ